MRSLVTGQNETVPSWHPWTTVIRRESHKLWRLKFNTERFNEIWKSILKFRPNLLNWSRKNLVLNSVSILCDSRLWLLFRGHEGTVSFWPVTRDRIVLIIFIIFILVEIPFTPVCLKVIVLKLREKRMRIKFVAFQLRFQLSIHLPVPSRPSHKNGPRNTIYDLVPREKVFAVMNPLLMMVKNNDCIQIAKSFPLYSTNWRRQWQWACWYFK